MGKHSRKRTNDKTIRLNNLDEIDSLNRKNRKSKKLYDFDELDSKSKNTVKKRNNKKFKKKKKTMSKFKKSVLKLLIIIFFIAFIIFFIWQIFECFKWQAIAKQMCQNTNSIVIDISGNTIESIGNERPHKNISSDAIPHNLKNAYVAIEDERFYNHSGVDFKRTGRCNFFLYFTFWKRHFWWKYYYTTTC